MMKSQRVRYNVHDFAPDQKDSRNTVFEVLTELPNSESSIDKAFIGALQVLLRDIDLGYLASSFQNVSLGSFLTYMEDDLRKRNLLSADINKIQIFQKNFHLKRWNVRSSLKLDGWKIKMDSEEILLAITRIVEQLYVDRMSLIYISNHLSLVEDVTELKKLKESDIPNDCSRAISAVCKMSRKLNAMIKHLNKQSQNAAWSLSPCDLIKSNNAKKHSRVPLMLFLSSVIVGVTLWKKSRYYS